MSSLPPSLPIARCRGNSCRAHIIWLPTPGGTRIPLDADPDEAGNVLIGRDLLGGLCAVVLSDGDAARARDANDELWMPHHASCPNAEEYRNG